MSLIATKVPEIQLENVEMRYQTDTADVLALHQVSLDIAKGSSSRFLGRPGAEKRRCFGSWPI